MVTKLITSLQHPIVKHVVKLRKSKPYRREKKEVLITGSSLIDELTQVIEPKLVVLLEEQKKEKFKKENCIHVTSSVLKKMTALEKPEPIAALFALPELEIPKQISRLLVLDHVSDPGNIGTLIRTARSLGWDSVFLLGSCCDPYNDKTLRASKGGAYYIPIIEGDEQLLESLINEYSLKLFVADLNGKDPKEVVFNESGYALLMGNESQGPGKWAKMCENRLTIKMQNEAESLNVAVAGAILMDRIGGGNCE